MVEVIHKHGIMIAQRMLVTVKFEHLQLKVKKLDFQENKISCANLFKQGIWDVAFVEKASNLGQAAPLRLFATL